MQNKANSQSPKWVLTAYPEQVYGKRCGPCARENKANSPTARRAKQSQFRLGRGQTLGESHTNGATRLRHIGFCLGIRYALATQETAGRSRPTG